MEIIRKLRFIRVAQDTYVAAIGDTSTLLDIGEDIPQDLLTLIIRKEDDDVWTWHAIRVATQMPLTRKTYCHSYREAKHDAERWAVTQ